jgi:hypothetical protein
MDYLATSGWSHFTYSGIVTTKYDRAVIGFASFPADGAGSFGL